jgi:large subunit ribosomal protein L18
MSVATRYEARLRRHVRVRKALSGTPERPRLNVFRSTNHIYAQLIDDRAGHTHAAASDTDPALAAEVKGKTKLERAAIVGRAVAQRATDKGIGAVVFDRGGFKYQGRVRALADAAREAGLQF